jgi:hypothetical protein
MYIEHHARPSAAAATSTTPAAKNAVATTGALPLQRLLEKSTSAIRSET